MESPAFEAYSVDEVEDFLLEKVPGCDVSVFSGIKTGWQPASLARHSMSVYSRI